MTDGGRAPGARFLIILWSPFPAYNTEPHEHEEKRLGSGAQVAIEVWSLEDNTSITGRAVFGVGCFGRRWYEESSLSPSSSEFEREDEDEEPEVEGVDDESLVV
jgi:hypothetical protein